MIIWLAVAQPTANPYAHCKLYTWHGRRVPTEVTFNAVIAGLLTEGRLQNGSVVDAGAHEGTHSCLYASLAPTRTVHAIEPLVLNVRAITRRWSHLPNLRVHHSGLGSVPREVDLGPMGREAMLQAEQLEAFDRTPKVRRRSGGSSFSPGGSASGGGSGTAFHIHRLDDLFASEPLALVHLDVEGGELDVLIGATHCLTRDRPLVTTEVQMLSKARRVRQLLAFMWGHGYESWMVDESCGYQVDCRNLLHIPRERMRTFVGSPSLDVAVASRAVLPIGNLSTAIEYVRKHQHTITLPRRMHRCGVRCGLGEMRARFGD